MNDCMTTQPLSIRAAMSGELDVINRVIESAVLTWDLPERVKRLSLPGLYYHETDLDFFDISVATDKKGDIVGVAVLENTPLRSGPDDKVALLLHGLYVTPTSRQLGIGRLLVNAIVGTLGESGVDGLLVKAQKDALGFFEAMGFRQLEIEDHARDYVLRYWKVIDD